MAHDDLADFAGMVRDVAGTFPSLNEMLAELQHHNGSFTLAELEEFISKAESGDDEYDHDRALDILVALGDRLQGPRYLARVSEDEHGLLQGLLESKSQTHH